MDKQSISSTLKREIPRLDNKEAFRIAGVLWGEITRYANAKKKEEARSVSGGNISSDLIKHYMESPMSPEFEAKGLRAILHAGIDTGNLPAPLLAALEKIIGINTGEDVKIEMVDFSTAFADMAEAIEICRRPCPVDILVKE